MHRLTLILSDLYLPEAGPGDAALTDLLSLPNLEWLQRFAHRRVQQNDWRSWLPVQIGRADLAAFAPAQLAACGRLPAAQVARSAIATPVRLEARLDHVRLPDRGLLRLGTDERAGWCTDFARSFGPELTLYDAGARGFLLGGLASTSVTTFDPARLMGADIGAALPRGPDSAAVRRLAAEIEMWMHGAPRNRDRERAGAARISTLWLWGMGERGDIPSPTSTPRETDVTFAGDDPFLAALSRTCTGTEPQTAPAGFEELSGAAGHAIVELTPLSDGPAGLVHADAHWLGPARAALGDGALGLLDLVANDRCFHVQARAGWRFWRRRRHWLASLRRPTPGAKA